MTFPLALTSGTWRWPTYKKVSLLQLVFLSYMLANYMNKLSGGWVKAEDNFWGSQEKEHKNTLLQILQKW